MSIGKWRRLEVSHTRFMVLFTTLLYGVCNALNVDKLAKWFFVKDSVDYFALSAFLLAGLCLFMAFFALLSHRLTIKPLSLLLVVVSAAITYFIAKYNVAVDSSMVMNALHTDAIEVRQLLSLQMVPYVVGLMIVPASIILSTEITFRSSGKYLIDSFKVVAVALIVAAVSLYSNYNAIHRAGNVSNKYIVYSLVPVNILSSSISVLSKTVKPYWQSTKKEIAISGRVVQPDNLVVLLAVGESSRRKSFSLYGYTRRNTNPKLARVDGLHLLNGVSTRGTTLYALPQILEKNDVKLTTMVSKLGIPTACFVNYTLYDNCAAVGETSVSECGHGGKCYDEDIVGLLQDNLKSYASGYRFVVLHLGGGSHGPVYADRHPPEFRQFKPTCDDADVANQCSVEQLYNSYDNTILYVDHVLSEVIQTLERSSVPYVFIYLSDHGESLMEEGRMFHGMPPGVSLPAEQAQIPLIVKSSIPISIVKRAEYTQPEVFDTILDLLSIETPMFDLRGRFIMKPGERATSPAAE